MTTEQDTKGWTADHDGGWRRKIGPFTLRVLRWFPDGPWRWEAVTPGFSGAVVARDAGPLTEPEALAGALAWARGTVEEMARAVGHEPATVRADPGFGSWMLRQDFTQNTKRHVRAELARVGE